MNSLFARLSLALLAIVGLMGGSFYWIERVNTTLYYEELTQRLNAPIGMYVTEQRQLIENGVADIDSLKELAGHAMVINPSAEIYLLDNYGRVLGHALPDDALARRIIDLGPITSLVDGSGRLPVRGDDPRNQNDQKVFSAAPIMSGDKLEGYLYVILGGQTYEALASDIGSFYFSRSSLIGLLVIVAAAATIGLVVFNLLTRRLKRLSREVASLSLPEPVDGASASALAIPETGGDEIDRLAATFDAMSVKLREQFEQLQENDRLRRELVANISHDLRTPLSAMQGYIETLLIKGNTLGDGERQRYLEIARQHTLRLGVLIGDLFELAKLDSASVTPSVESFSLSELVHDIALEFQIEAERRNIELSVRRSAGSAMTMGDIGLIQRVLENLVRNAIRFTPAGGEIILEIAERNRSVAIAVSDTGPGIPEQDIPRIFDRFFRSEQGEEARSESSGLGLAIVKRILDLHGSTISVTSRVDAGTRFEFELPRLKAAA